MLTHLQGIILIMSQFSACEALECTFVSHGRYIQLAL